MKSRKHEARVAGVPLTFLAVGEILITLWLLIKGARSEPLEHPSSR
jgi:hypothetical protein